MQSDNNVIEDSYRKMILMNENKNKKENTNKEKIRWLNGRKIIT